MIENNFCKNKRPNTNIFLLYLRELNNILSQTKNNFQEWQIFDIIYNLSNSIKQNFFSLNKKLIINSNNTQISQFYIASSQTANISY